MLKPRFKKIRENDGVVEVDGVKLDAESAEVVFADKDKDIQVVVSNDPENDNTAVVAVLTNSKEEVEDEQVLGSASVETEGDKEEKCKEARREAFRKRLEARRAARKTDERREAFRKRLEARKAAKQTESKAKAIEEARAKFRSKIKKA